MKIAAYCTLIVGNISYTNCFDNLVLFLDLIFSNSIYKHIYYTCIIIKMDVPNILNYLISSTYMTFYVPNKLKFELSLRKR
jgi:hypothetical protein